MCIGFKFLISRVPFATRNVHKFHLLQPGKVVPGVDLASIASPSWLCLCPKFKWVFWAVCIDLEFLLFEQRESYHPHTHWDDGPPLLDQGQRESCTLKQCPLCYSTKKSNYSKWIQRIVPFHFNNLNHFQQDFYSCLSKIALTSHWISSQLSVIGVNSMDFLSL